MANPGARLFPTAKNFANLERTEYVELWVGNAKQSAVYYQKCFGFQPVAYKGLETGSRDTVSYVMRQNDIVIVLTSPLNGSNKEINDHLIKHGDSVKFIALSVEDANQAFLETTKRGAEPYKKSPWKAVDEKSGQFVEFSAIKTYGDTVHLFLSGKNKYTAGPFLPGYVALSGSSAASHNVGLEYIDHMVGNVDWNEMEKWADFYSRVFGMDQLISFDDKDISTDYTALKSKVMTNDTGLVKYPINEPARGIKKSQIEEYIEFNSGPGVQHIALATNDIVRTVGEMRDRGVEFLRVPDSYYDQLSDRVGEIEEDVEVLKNLGILVDRDDKGYLLQIFTKPLTDRPTLFFEIIQRRGGFSFGKGNFKALFVSIEEEQRKRGTL
ncbi:hydroxyphenyl pyruvate dioxygenase [Perkinsus sp. BL_2016]|nr:hydroxyphenyl pyruvate dioxygenase [Perkinsus sp. BL_2016]